MPKDETSIVAIYDAGSLHWDRYTVFFDDLDNQALCLSYFLGYSEFATATQGEHVGRRIRFDALPKHLQDHIIERINYAQRVEAAQ